jgi:DNA oxidative demethylase
MTGPAILQPGLLHWPGLLDRVAQQHLAESVRNIVQAAPLFTPRMPKTGKAFSVRMTNCGNLGWVSDQSGYRYQPLHPETGAPWPPIPDQLLTLWKDLSGHPAQPEACLVNVYEPSARMGLHQDKDERDFSAPVLSVSLGDDCLFRFGEGQSRAPTRSVTLRSGDVLLLSGPSRLCFHGVDRIHANTSALLRQPGRVNLTLRVTG